MIAELVLFETSQAEFIDLVEKMGVNFRDGTNGFKVAGSGSLQVHQALRPACGSRIDAEFV